MREIKKGTEKNSAPNTHNYHNRLSIICIVISFISLLGMYQGHFTHNRELEAMGLGITAVMVVIQTYINTKGD